MASHPGLSREYEGGEPGVQGFGWSVEGSVGRRLFLDPLFASAIQSLFRVGDTLAPSKRVVLDQLKRDELALIADHFGLQVADRRSTDALVDSVARSRKAVVETFLPLLSRDRLKELCESFGLEAGGRDKETLIERLLGHGSGDGADSSPAAKRGSGATAETVELPATGQLTVDQFERYLWSAADILRGSIDSSDNRNFIFGLLFLKRLSDRFEEEAEKLVADGLAADVAWNDPDEHQFFVPPRARWSSIQKTTTKIGEMLPAAPLGVMRRARHASFQLADHAGADAARRLRRRA